MAKTIIPIGGTFSLGYFTVGIGQTVATIMTVSYSNKVGTANKIGAFLKLLLVWKGSVYKLVWCDYLIYLSLYFSVSAIYRFALNDEQMRQFEQLSRFFDDYSSLIPLTFVLAFYVSHVISRWWDQWNSIPWPDSIAFKVNAYVNGDDEHSRLVRRNVVRYACLAIVDTLCMVSTKVKKRFPTKEHLVEAGLLTEEELLAIKRAQLRSEYMNYTYWMPISWASTLLVHAQQQNYIATAKYTVDMNNELGKLRTQCAVVICYDWISLPLVYTQVVTLAVYSFFGVTVLGRQWLDPDRVGPHHGHDGHGGLDYDFVFPVFTSLQFVFYVGWLRVAEALLNPYGEDDEDFDTNFMVDRNLQIAYLMVDEVGQYPPQPEKDPHWEVGVPSELPYTLASLPFRGELAETNAEKLRVPLGEQRPVFAADRADDYRKMANSNLMLNNMVNNVVNWAQSPLGTGPDVAAMGGVQQPSFLSAMLRRSQRAHAHQMHQPQRSCSTAVPPSPSHLIHRNSSLRRSFKPGTYMNTATASGNVPSPLSREPSQQSSLGNGCASRKASSVVSATSTSLQPVKEEGNATEVPTIIVDSSPSSTVPLPPPLNRSVSQNSDVSSHSTASLPPVSSSARKQSSVGSASLHTVHEEETPEEKEEKEEQNEKNEVAKEEIKLDSTGQAEYREEGGERQFGDMQLPEN